MPPAAKFTTGSLPLAATSSDQLPRGLEPLRLCHQLRRVHRGEPAHGAHHCAHVPDGLHDIARARLALGADHGRPLRDPAQRLPQIARAADERHRKGVLVDVILLVRRCEDLALIDVVDAERLQDLRLDEVPDARLCHHGDRDGSHDLLDEGGVAHARHSSRRADVRRHPLQRHDGHGSRLLGDPRMIGGHHVHDHPAFEHLRQALLGGECR